MQNISALHIVRIKCSCEDRGCIVCRKLENLTWLKLIRVSILQTDFAGTAPMKSSKKPSQQDVPSTTTPPASNNSSSSGGSSGYRSSASRLTAPNNSSSSNYPTETRSSGSGESTPVGTIITNKHGKKTDLYRNYSDLRSVLNLDEDDGDDGIFKGDEDVSPDGSSVLGRDESDSEQLTPKVRKPSFRQFTLHLDKISSLEDDESFTSDLQHVSLETGI